MAEAEEQQIVDVSLKDFFNAVKDYEAYPRFVSGMKSAKVVATTTETKKVSFDLEMLKRLNYTLEIQEKVNDKFTEARVWWKLASSDFFKHNNGSWELKSLGENKTQVTYKLDLEFNFFVPGFILKKLVNASLPNAIKEFTSYAKERRTYDDVQH